MSAPLTPAETVLELDRFIVGQSGAKRAVAIALRNRWRRQRLEPELAEEVLPKNIIMIGPTGVGKTEVARRLAKLANAPFVKVEASKFTEVGYVGRDVESMIRDLMETALSSVKAEHLERVNVKAAEMAEEKILDLLLPPPRKGFQPLSEEDEGRVESPAETKEKLRALLKKGALDDRYVDVDIREKVMPMGIVSNMGMDELEINLKEMLGNFMPERSKTRKVRVPEAVELLKQEEAARLIDMDGITEEARLRAENAGIVFIDEVDKVAGRSAPGHGPDVSREGVQRDLLPIVEGSTVNTKHGPVRTDHVLFIAAGAFTMAKPSDLVPELQGRFPIRVELDPLGGEDFIRILTEPKNALIKTVYRSLETENLSVEFTPDAVREIAMVSEKVNERTENIGARRLHTVLEKLLEEISFEAPSRAGEHVLIDAEYVSSRLQDIVKSEDLSRYIL